MALIPLVDYKTTNDSLKEQIDDQIKLHGRVTNMKRTLLHSLPAFHALMEWYTLRDEVRCFIGDKGVNYFCHAISTQNSCLVCSTFFRKILIDGGENPEHLVLDSREELLVEFGQLCVSNPEEFNEEFLGRLHGYFTDEQVVLLTAFAGMMVATNLINTVLKVDLDSYLDSYARR